MMESSYSVIKVFVAAIPILGFIGTVIGIGQAVNAFAEFIQSAQDLSVLKEGLRAVTSGLGVAFDTTLLALSVSLLITLPMTLLQRDEERFLGQVDEYCTNNLFARLHSDPMDRTSEQKGAIQEAIASEMAKHHAEFQAWTVKLETLGEKIVTDVSDGMSKLCRTLEGRETALAQRRAQTEAALMKLAHKKVAALQAQAEKGFKEALESVLAATKAVLTDTATRVDSQVSQLQAISETVQETVMRAAETQVRNMRLLADAAENHREKLARMQSQGEALHHTLLACLDRLVPASGPGLTDMISEMQTLTGMHRTRMDELSRNLVRGMDILDAKGQRVSDTMAELNANLGQSATTLVKISHVLEAQKAHGDNGNGRSAWGLRRLFGRKECVRS